MNKIHNSLDKRVSRVYNGKVILFGGNNDEEIH